MMLVVRMPRVVFSIGVVAYLLGGAPWVHAQTTTTYGSGGSSNTFTGGYIIPGDTVLLNDGADVTGDIHVDGTLQFNQSAGNTLTISNLIGGTGTLSLTNTGVLNLTCESGGVNAVNLDMTTSASLGVLQIISASGDLWVGGNVTGTLNVTGGYVSNANGYLGFYDEGVGTATVSSGTWANSGNLIVGNGDSTGTLTMTGGLVSVAGILSRGSFGTINLNSGGTLQIGVGGNTGGLNVSTLTNNGTLIFNRSDNSTYTGIISGTGTVTKQGAGTLTLGGLNSYSGGTTISTGGITVATGGAISHASADLFIGRSFGESGTLNVNGGSVTNSIGYLGYDAGSNGTATVSKGTWANSADLYVGVGGTGTLNVTGGDEEEDEDGYVSNTTGYLGYDADSVGTATVSSGTWANSADLYVGVDGTGTLTMTGGLVTVGGTLSQGSFGTINLDSGGTLQIGVGGTTGVLGVSTLTNNGTLIFNRSDDSTYSGIISGAGVVTKQGAGTLTLGGVNSYSGGTTISAGGVTVAAGGAISHASADLYVGDSGTGTLNVTGGYVSIANGRLGVDAGSVGTATVSSGTWANSGELGVGLSGTGTLNVSGGYVSNNSGLLGYAVGSNGTATVSGGTWANSADLTVGYRGRGTLNVTGGRVSNNAAVLGAITNGVGTATVSSGTWANSSNLDVGASGTGTLDVNGGFVSSTGNSHIGRNAGGVGTATVSSGTWANTGALRVGDSGNGTLNVSGGSVNVTGAGFLGRQTGGVGTATVSSGTWAMSGNFQVGGSGRGTLNVTGGLVSSNDSTLGAGVNSVGTANVSSGTWASLGGLTVGNSGTGTLNLTGGLVAVAGTLSKGIYGTINLNSGGTLQIGVGDRTGVLGVSTLTNNGTLIFSGSSASTYSGSVSGTGVVTKLGLGTLTLSGSNGYAGVTNINGGALALGNASALAGGGTISFGGGSLRYSASNTVDYATRILNSGSAIWIDTNSQDVTFESRLGSSNTGGLTKSGLGTLTLSASNDYIGVTNINGGVLALGNASAFAGGGTISFGGGSLQYSASNTLEYSTRILNSGSAISIDTNGQNVTFASGLGSSNTGGLTKSGLGTLTLSASNGYTGGTTITGGQLKLVNANALAAANAMTITSGTLDLNGQSRTLGSLYGSSGGTITTGTTGLITLTSSAAASSTYAGSINNGAGTIAFTKSGLGTLTLSGSNGYTGVTNINGGALALGTASALAGGGTISFGGGSLQYSASNTLDYCTRILNSGSAIWIDTNSQNITFASNLGSSNTGGLTKSGLGTLTLSVSNDYTGVTNINGGVLALGNASAFAGGGTISFGGGSLQYSASNTVDYSARILNSGSAISIDTNGQDVTFASGLSSSNTGGLTKSGDGILTLSASNGYTGGTTISGGQLKLANANALAAANAMTITSGTLDLNGQSRTIGSLSGSSGGTITTGTTGLITLTSSAAASSTYAGSINNGAGTIAFTKSGLGTLTLSGSNGYTGVTNINGGALALGTASALAGGGTISFGGGSLRYSASNTVDYSTRILNSGSAISIDTNGQNITFASGMGSSNTGGLTKSGLGTLTLSVGNDYTGATNINGGVLALGNASALAGGGTISFGGGSLQYSASNTVDYSSRILNSGSAISIDTNGQNVAFASGLGASNTGGLTKVGLGTLTLSASNDYTGRTIINGGVLALGNASALAGTGTISFGGGSLQYSASNTVDYSARILNSGSAISIDTNGQNVTFASGLGSSNTGGLTKSGDGTLTLSGSNGYTGGTTISGGQLTLANANALAAAGAMTITSGTLDLNGQSRTLGSLSGSSGGTITTGTTGLITLTSSAAANSTYAGSINNGAGTIAFTKQGLGTLTLSGSNDYTGATNINGGVLSLGNASAFAGGGTISFGGGSLQYSAGNTVDYSTRILNSGSAISIDTNGQDVTFASGLGSSNTGGLTKSGLGTLTLSASNDYTGRTTINGGVLALGNASALAGTGTISFGGGSLQYSASNTVDYSIRILNSGSAISIDTNGQNVTFASNLGSSNTGGLTKSGDGILTLSASNGYTGATTVNSGVLAYGVSNALSDSTAVTVAGGGLNLGSYDDTVSSFTITSGSLFGSGKLTAATYALGGGTVTGNLGGGSMTVTDNTNLNGTADVTSVSLNAGTLTLGSAGRFTSSVVALTGSSGANLSLGGNESVGSLAGGFNVALGSATLTTGNNNTSTTYSGILSGSGGLTKAGAGTFTLSGSNDYTGVTNINGGVLALGNASALTGGGTISFGGGSLRYSASNTVDYSTRILNSGSAISIDTNGQNVTFASGLGSSNTGGLTKLGLGTLTLSAGNDYAGVTNINGGVLALGNASALAGTGTISFGGGSLQYSASNTVDYSARILNSGSAISIDTNGQNVTFASGLGSSNTGGLTKSGLGTLTLSASNGYTGSTTISGGQLTLANANALAAAGAMTITSGTLDLNGQSRTLGLLNGSSGGTITTGTTGLITLTSSAAANSTYAGSIINGAGTIAFMKQGVGTLTLSGSNDYTGATNINGGALSLGNASALAGGGTISFGGGSLQYSASNTVDYSARILNSGSAISIDTNGQSINFASGLGSSNTGGLTKLGLGTLTLSAGNDYAGATNINGGVLALGNASALTGTGTISFGGGSLQYSASNTVDYSPTILNSGSAISIDTNGQNVTFASNLGSSNTGGLTKLGLGTLTLSASNDYTGRTNINGGVLALGNASALAGTGTISFGGGSLQYSASNTVDYSTRILNSGSAISIDTNGQNITFASSLGSSNTGGLTKSGDGILTLSASNGYTGGTTISGCQLTLANANALAATGAMTITSGTLDLNGQSRTLGSLSGSSGGTITTGTTGLITLTSSAAANSTYAGSINNGAGTIGFTKQGAGTLTLSGSNDYTGRTNINGGVLALGNTSALAGTGTISFGGGTLQYSASNTVDYSTRILNSGSAIWIDTNGQNVTFASGLGSSNTGGLTKSGLGTLTLSASNDYTGATAVNGGVLALGNASALAGTGTISFGGGSLQYSASNTVDYSIRILNSGSAISIDTNGQNVTFASNLGSSNTGGLTKSGRGTLTLSASNGYTGGTLISGGQLKLANANALAAANAMTITSGTLDLNGQSSTLGLLNGSFGGTITTGTAGLITLTSSAAASSTYAGSINNGDGTIAFTKQGAGTLTLSGSNGYTGATTIQQGTLNLAHVAALSASTITPMTGGTMTLTPYLQTTVGGLDPNAGGLVDVGNGYVTVANGLSQLSLVAALQSGRAGGSWTGSSGITSSAAASAMASSTLRSVGWLDNGNGSMTFAYAAPGDSNLDWIVDVLDAGNFIAFGKFDTGLPATWIEGDFNYDATVDILDAADFFATGLYDTGYYNSPAGSIAAVPEPNVLGMFGVGAGVVGLLVMRRKRAA